MSDPRPEGAGALVVTDGADIAAVQHAAGTTPVYRVGRLDADSVRAAGADPEDVAAVLGASPGDPLDALPRLRWVHSRTAGVDAWLAPDTLPDGVVLTSAAGNGAVPLAEHALMLMLMLSRNASRWLEAQRRHVWDRFTHGEIAGTVLGLVGYGNSGQDLARKAQACHMQVQALRRDAGAQRHAGVDVLTGRDGLEQLLSTSDYIVVTTPLTPRTQDLIGRAELARMKPTAFLIVTSRGGIVSETALIEALRTGVIAGAGLDAHATEPLPATSPLWDLDNVIVTPHNGATTPATARRGTEIMLDNVSRWVRGQELRNVVDRSRGY